MFIMPEAPLVPKFKVEGPGQVTMRFSFKGEVEALDDVKGE